MKFKKKIPPPLAKKLLLVFLRRELAEEVQGDLEEQFYVTQSRKSLFKARLNYWYQVFNYLRPFAMDKIKSRNSNHYTMYKNYFKVAWRGMSKQKMYTAIKVGGFALGIAACLLITLFVRDELSYDRHYPDGDRIYRVVGILNMDGEALKNVHFPAPFAGALKEDYPEVEVAGRLLSSELFGAGSKEVRRPEELQSTHETGFVYGDEGFLEILQIPMVYGSPEHTLDQPSSIVISKRKADQYFPGENPLGKTLILDNNTDNPYKIGGVMENFPKTSHLQYDFIMTMTGLNFYPGEQTNWGANNYHTYVLVRSETDIAQLEAKLHGIVDKYWLPLWQEAGKTDALEWSKSITFELQPISDIHLRSEGIRDRLAHGDIRFVWLFGAIAGFIMIIACINFINLSTAKSANRAKEVGLRKVVGSKRGNLVRQFLTESVLFSGLSFILGAILAWLFLPYFNLLAAKSLVFPWAEWWLAPLLILSAIFIGVVAGLYPAFYLSGFKPVDTLKGGLSRVNKKSGIRSMLVIFQFTTSIVLIIGTVVIYRQMEYILDTKVGFDKEQVLLLKGANTMGDKIPTFKDRLLQLSEVQHVSVSDYLPISGTKRNQNQFWNEGRTKIDKSVGAQRWWVDHDYIKTMGMKIVEGRDFSTSMASDSQAIIINQTMARGLNLDDPIGKLITNRGSTWHVIGVIEDFNYESLRQNIEGLCLTIGNSPSIISVKVNTANMSGAIGSITAVWKDFSPNQPIRYTFLDESFAKMYEDVQRMGRIFSSLAGLAIIIACLGLFALSAFMAEQRQKEISVRLVLGATFRNVIQLLSRNFIKLVLVSLAIAVPIGHFMMRKWLEDFAYQTNIGWDVFFIAGLMALAIALLTISYQCIRAALTNPVQGLKSE